MASDIEHHIHLVSDSTGETLNAMIRACLAPFGETRVQVHTNVFVRSTSDLETVLGKLRAAPGLVCYTLVDREQRSRLEETCASLGVAAIPALDPLMARLSETFGQAPTHGVGMQHQLDASYFNRITALDFAIAHDDGALGTRLRQADVILTGVSRTSKTPTCIYLAYRGTKAANMPLIPGQDPHPAFFEAHKAGTPVIGLTASPSRLVQIRTERIEALGDRATDYADLDRVREEVSNARLLFDRLGVPVIDVTRRSIEETAAAVLAVLEARRDASG